jgi:DNA-binding transcriptional regulator YiaG
MLEADDVALLRWQSLHRQAHLATRPSARGVLQMQCATVGEWTGVEVRALRIAKRMTAKEFAALLGVSSGLVGKWERAAVTLRLRPAAVA